MAFVNLNPGTLLAPVPVVLVSCARKGEKPNAVTIAWAGTVNSDPPMVSVSVRPERYSHDIIEETGEFVVNFCGQDNLKATDITAMALAMDNDMTMVCFGLDEDNSILRVVRGEAVGTTVKNKF